MIIDSWLPVYANNESNLVFARCKNSNEFWVPLIEKAYAKLHGNYEILTSGNIDEALQELTGMVAEKILAD